MTCILYEYYYIRVHSLLTGGFGLSNCNRTVALTDFYSRNFLTKVHLNKKSGGRKTRRFLIGIQFPYQTRSSFFCLRFFFGVNFCKQTPGTYLHHTVLLVGVTDPGNSGAFVFES
jgi:hypothetical protein